MKKKYIAINDLLDLSEELQTEELAHELLMSGESERFVAGVCWGFNHFVNQAFLDPRCIRFDVSELNAAFDNGLPLSLEDVDFKALEKKILDLEEKCKHMSKSFDSLENKIALVSRTKDCPHISSNTNSNGWLPHSPFTYCYIMSNCNCKDK